jgi:hypothetical protein
MSVLRTVAAALYLGATPVAQDAAVSSADGAPKVTTRVIHIRDEPLPMDGVGLTSAGISADGHRLVVGIKSVGPSHLDMFAGKPGWPDKYKRGPDSPTAYVYDCETDSSTELRPTLDGKVWRLIGPPAISPYGRFVAAACEPEATYSNESVGRGSTVAIVDTLGDKSRLLDLKSLGVKAPVAWYFGAPALARDAAFLAVPTTPDIGNDVRHGWTMLWNRDAGTMQAAVFDDGYSHTMHPGLSDDGRFLVVGATGSYDDGRPDTGLLIDTGSGKTTVVSAWADGTLMTNGGVWSCAISGDGSTVAFVSRPGPSSPASDAGAAVGQLVDHVLRGTRVLRGNGSIRFPSCCDCVARTSSALSGLHSYFAPSLNGVRFNSIGSSCSSINFQVRRIGS